MYRFVTIIAVWADSEDREGGDGSVDPDLHSKCHFHKRR